MIALRSIPDFPIYFDTTFLDGKDIPIMLLIIILMLFTYRKIKNYKPSTDPIDDFSENEIPIRIDSRDILMQPKENNSNLEIPFINFSINKVYIIYAIIAVIVILNYIWNYEISESYR
ncbi:MAG: hypothetical protein CMC14_14430 [Flavobacteriaceae bacterium]|nr:hypothetical protein [Flavobacteriaceae bacterium]|tara:strand:+ start:925 stop:1278 length:354 start_codon:yes stop_codon:yes gene_type:complete